MLKIDLSNSSYDVDGIPEDIIRKYVGGRGLGSYLLYRSVPVGADPLGEKNHLIFTADPASGSGLFYSSKVNLCTKSPLTGIYLNSICSGTLAAQIRKAGFWAIDIRGVSEAPVSIVINDKDISFRDGANLWGEEPAKTQKALLGDYQQRMRLQWPSGRLERSYTPMPPFSAKALSTALPTLQRNESL